MLLQTVVENAIKHGIAELPQGGVLRISAEVRDGALIIEVENPRPATPSQSPSPGVGLRNAAERLRLLFGSAAALDLDLSQPDRALARIRIPQATMKTMSPMKAMIVDDEPLARRELRRLAGRVSVGGNRRRGRQHRRSREGDRGRRAGAAVPRHQDAWRHGLRSARKTRARSARDLHDRLRRSRGAGIRGECARLPAQAHRAGTPRRRARAGSRAAADANRSTPVADRRKAVHPRRRALLVRAAERSVA